MSQGSKAGTANDFPFIPVRYRDWLAYALILIAVFAFFGDAIFGGKNFLGESDNVAFWSFIPYLEQAKQGGEFPLWVPYIFGGMPSMASFLAAGDRSWDFMAGIIFAVPRLIGEVFSNDTARMAMWYVIYGWGMYSLMRLKDHRRIVALFTAYAAVFSTFIIVWIMIGHNSKPVAFASFPWLLLALERMRRQASLLNAFLLILPMLVMVSSTHPQMMFYLACATVLYMLVEVIHRTITRHNPTGVLVAVGALAIATGLALATHADFFLASRDYTPYSTRGSAPISQSANNAQDQTGGNDYQYATNWSFSPGETITFLVPNYYGFGKLKADSKSDRVEHLYWGQMPFTDAANYMGIGVFFLAIVGFAKYRRDPFVLFLGALGLFSLLLSFGKNAPFLYDLFYNYIPVFNKFRAPAMALALLQFAVPVLAGYGLTWFVDVAGRASAHEKKTAFVFGGVAAAFLLVGLLYAGVAESAYKTSVAEAFVAKGQVESIAQFPSAYANKIFDLMKSDWQATGLIALLYGGLVMLMVVGRLKPRIALPLLLVLTLFDLWRVAKRPYSPEKTSPEKTVFATTDVVRFLKNDPSTFRIADLSRTPPNAWAYHFLEHVHGYSSAKLRIYQDLLDEAGKGGGSAIANPFLWDMLNVKYIIADQPIYQGVRPDFTSQQTRQLVYVNPSAMPRAWFVDSTARSTPRYILKHLHDADFDLSSLAWVESNDISTEPATGSTIELKERGNHLLRFEVNAVGNNFAVISEPFYPEWHAFLNGNEVPMYRTNYVLRGVSVPPGKHTLEFRYISRGFETGRTLSWFANGIVLALGVGGVLIERRRRKTKV